MNTSSNLLADLTAPIIATIAVAFGLGVIAPNASFAQDSKDKKRQSDKNLMRNLTIGLGAAAVYEGLRGKTTNAAVLGAGAALSGKKYEDARKAQSKENNNRYGYSYPGYNPGYNDNDRYRDDDRFNRNDRYDRNDRFDDNGRFGNDGRYDRNDRPGNYRYNDNGRFGNDRYDNRRDPRDVSYKTPQPRRDNGNHNGWNKKQRKGDCD